MSLPGHNPVAAIIGFGAQPRKLHCGVRRKQTLSLTIGNDRVWVGSCHCTNRAANGGFARFISRTRHAGIDPEPDNAERKLGSGKLPCPLIVEDS